jgi:hypothetical protein
VQRFVVVGLDVGKIQTGRGGGVILSKTRFSFPDRSYLARGIIEEGSVRSGTVQDEGEGVTSSNPAATEVLGLQGLIPPPDDKKLQETVESLIEAGGGSVAAVLLYGSHVQNSSPDQNSAYDFVVLVDGYSRFFKAMGTKAHQRRPTWVLTLLSHFLPPNIISFGKGETGLARSKCAIVNPRHLKGFLGPHSRDHFLKGRAVQKLALAWTRGPEDKVKVVSALRVARENLTQWVRPFVGQGFELKTFARTMLQVSYQGEIRPEASDRVDEVFASQTQVLLAIAQEALDAAIRDGLAEREGDLYRWTRNPGGLTRAWYRLYFTSSKARAVARWFKYVVTFDGWIDYIIRKIERRAGFKVEVTERERRWPVIFLWPKFFRVVKALLEAGRRPEPTDRGEGAS